MSKYELQKIFDNTPAESYKEKVKQIEDYFISIADGVNVIGNGKEHTLKDTGNINTLLQKVCI